MPDACRTPGCRAEGVPRGPGWLLPEETTTDTHVAVAEHLAERRAEASPADGQAMRPFHVAAAKGHVAVALSKHTLIHAYGPSKKTIVMPIRKTIDRIYKTANLKVLGIRRIT